MSWSDVFPVFEMALFEHYNQNATQSTRGNLWAEKQIFNAHKKQHLISMGIFQLPHLTSAEKSNTEYPRKMCCQGKPLSWREQADTVVREAKKNLPKWDNVSFRVYLAGELKHLIPELLDCGCEVRLMENSENVGFAGGLWRFLALEEDDLKVTVINLEDPRCHAGFEGDILRTEEAVKGGLGLWRFPWLREDKEFAYRPICGAVFGGKCSIPVRLLIEALIWQTQRGSIQPVMNLPDGGKALLQEAYWDSPGFDDWFLLTVVYPLSAFSGIQTYVPNGFRSDYLALDIEYCTWANPQSELHYFKLEPPVRKAPRSNSATLS